MISMTTVEVATNVNGTEVLYSSVIMPTENVKAFEALLAGHQWITDEWTVWQ